MSKTTKLIQSLISATNSKSLEWKATAEESIYQISFPKYTIQISREDSTQPDSSGSDDIVIRLFNAEGQQIDEVRDWYAEIRSEMQQPYTTLNGFYMGVQRQVLGIDEAYDYLLKELGELPF